MVSRRTHTHTEAVENLTKGRKRVKLPLSHQYQYAYQFFGKLWDQQRSEIISKKFAVDWVKGCKWCFENIITMAPIKFFEATGWECERITNYIEFYMHRKKWRKDIRKTPSTLSFYPIIYAVLYFRVYIFFSFILQINNASILSSHHTCSRSVYHVFVSFRCSYIFCSLCSRSITIQFHFFLCPHLHSFVRTRNNLNNLCWIGYGSINNRWDGSFV